MDFSQASLQWCPWCHQAAERRIYSSTGTQTKCIFHCERILPGAASRYVGMKVAICTASWWHAWRPSCVGWNYCAQIPVTPLNSVVHTPLCQSPRPAASWWAIRLVYWLLRHLCLLLLILFLMLACSLATFNGYWRWRSLVGQRFSLNF